MQKYQFVKQLGDGSYGSVHLAKNAETGEQLAIKKYICNIYPMTTFSGHIQCIYSTYILYSTYTMHSKYIYITHIIVCTFVLMSVRMKRDYKTWKECMSLREVKVGFLATSSLYCNTCV